MMRAIFSRPVRLLVKAITKKIALKPAFPATRSYRMNILSIDTGSSPFDGIEE
jgi:hypothetical protein